MPLPGLRRGKTCTDTHCVAFVTTPRHFGSAPACVCSGRGTERRNMGATLRSWLSGDGRWADRDHRSRALLQLRALIRWGWPPQGSEDRLEVLQDRLTYGALHPLLPKASSFRTPLLPALLPPLIPPFSSSTASPRHHRRRPMPPHRRLGGRNHAWAALALPAVAVRSRRGGPVPIVRATDFLERGVAPTMPEGGNCNFAKKARAGPRSVATAPRTPAGSPDRRVMLTSQEEARH